MGRMGKFCVLLFFFFQAEDGIRDVAVTGVQTCALPIYPHGHVFDRWGRDIVFDATGGQPYFGPSMSTKKYYPAMESTKAPRPGQVRTRPVGGAEMLTGSHFPDEMQGNLVVLNTIGFRGLLNYKVTEDGSGLKMTEVEPILESADENFRPVDAEVGADGALYVADWQNPEIVR